MRRTDRPRGLARYYSEFPYSCFTLRPHFWGVGVRRALGVCTTSSFFFCEAYTLRRMTGVTIWFDGSHVGLVLGETVKLH